MFESPRCSVGGLYLFMILCMGFVCYVSGTEYQISQFTRMMQMMRALERRMDQPGAG